MDKKKEEKLEKKRGNETVSLEDKNFSDIHITIDDPLKRINCSNISRSDILTNFSRANDIYVYITDYCGWSKKLGCSKSNFVLSREK